MTTHPENCPPPPPPPCRLLTSRVCGSSRIAGPEGAFSRAGGRAGQHTVHNQCQDSKFARREGMFHTTGWWLLTDVSGQTLGPTFKEALEGGTDRLCRNGGCYRSALRSIPQERKSEITRSPHHVRASLLVMVVSYGMFHGFYQTDDAVVRLASLSIPRPLHDPFY